VRSFKRRAKFEEKNMVPAMKFLAVLLLACLATAAQAADYPLKIIPLQHRSAEELIPVIRPLLRPGEAVTGVRYQLFLRASDASQRDVERMVGALDQPRRNLRVTVQQGFVEGAGEESSRYQVYRSTGSQQDASQFVNVLEGVPAFIQVGKSVPYVQRFLALAGPRIVVAEGVEFQDVVTGFQVVARVVGGRIELDIAPQLSFIGDRFDNRRAPQVVNFQELHTTVSVRPGEWVDLAGATANLGEVSNAIWDTASTQLGERRTVRLRVDEVR
jgi:type II secretory pathway component GspD/PulD (secretin)